MLHELWIQEGYTSPAFLTAATVAFPSAAVASEELILQVTHQYEFLCVSSCAAQLLLLGVSLTAWDSCVPPQDSPYILGLGAAGSHETFRPLILKICNSTFLPATDVALAAEEVPFNVATKPLCMSSGAAR